MVAVHARMSFKNLIAAYAEKWSLLTGKALRMTRFFGRLLAGALLAASFAADANAKGANAKGNVIGASCGRVVGSAHVGDVTEDDVFGMIKLGKCPPAAMPGR